MSPWCQLFRCWWHHSLWIWRPELPSVITQMSTWHSYFSVSLSQLTDTQSAVCTVAKCFRIEYPNHGRFLKMCIYILEGTCINICIFYRDHSYVWGAEQYMGDSRDKAPDIGLYVLSFYKTNCKMIRRYLPLNPAETRWLTFSRRNFQIDFLVLKLPYFDWNIAALWLQLTFSQQWLR